MTSKLNSNMANPHTIFLKPVDKNETLRRILSLNNYRSSGYDNINTKILKACALHISSPLTHIISLSLSEGEFSEKIKMCIVKPLIKNKGDRVDPNSYRPITLVRILSKKG